MSGYTCDTNPSSLGGGIPGGQPRGGLLGGGGGNGGSGMVGGNTRGIDRLVLRKGFGRVHELSSRRIITPFRQANNAGDINGSVNSEVIAGLPTHSQVGGVGAKQLVYGRAGGVHSGGRSAYTGNPKYVYDGSDYTRFKKLQAKNRNYNDKSFGGSNNGSYVPLRRVRH